jgi:putative transposase
MKGKRFSVEQIIGVLKQAEAGVPVLQLIRKVGTSEQAFYRWKKQYVELEIDQVRQLKQLQEKHTRLKQLVAELSLDKTMLQDVLRKNSEALAPPSAGRFPEGSPSDERATRRPGSEPGALHFRTQRLRLTALARQRGVRLGVSHGLLAFEVERQHAA